MENASKALLIAGAVLICIVLISVGMVIVQSSQDVTDQVGDITSTQAAQTFNSQFTKYAGTQKGSSVKSLLETVAANNKATASTGAHLVKVTFTDGSLNGSSDSSAITKAMTNVVNSKKYTITVEALDNDGFVQSIKIVKK